jgi:hypothetical protein
MQGCTWITGFFKVICNLVEENVPGTSTLKDLDWKLLDGILRALQQMKSDGMTNAGIQERIKCTLFTFFPGQQAPNMSVH